MGANWPAALQSTQGYGGSPSVLKERRADQGGQCYVGSPTSACCNFHVISTHRKVAEIEKHGHGQTNLKRSPPLLWATNISPF